MFFNSNPKLIIIVHIVVLLRIFAKQICEKCQLLCFIGKMSTPFIHLSNNTTIQFIRPQRPFINDIQHSTGTCTERGDFVYVQALQ